MGMEFVAERSRHLNIGAGRIVWQDIVKIDQCGFALLSHKVSGWLDGGFSCRCARLLNLEHALCNGRIFFHARMLEQCPEGHSRPHCFTSHHAFFNSYTR